MPFFLMLLSFGGRANAQNAAVPLAAEAPAGIPADDYSREAAPLFPAAYYLDYFEARAAKEAAQPYWAAAEGEPGGRPSFFRRESVLLNNDILAFYGHPRSKNMGILGRHSKEELNERLGALAEEYEAAGGRKILKAFYIIFGTVWPGGEIGIIQEALLKEYVDFALENGLLVFIDHQIGKYSPAESLEKMLPWLKYPNVHLALDPEWRTDKPMEEIGTISGEELNQAQQIMEDYLAENRIPGERLLVIHQFNWRMISNREKVNGAFSRVRPVHCADGFGKPNVKRALYAYNALAANMPVKGFKLFYESGIPGAGYDSPLLTPKEVFALNPRPYIVMYQ